MIIAGTGHRPQKLGGFKLPNPIYNFVCQETVKIIKEYNPDKIISGMALGYDQYLASIAIKLNIPFIAAIPFEGQEKAWPEKSQRVYQALLNKACESIIVTPGGYAAYKMQFRNQYMVDRCDILIAVWDGTSGGTGNCVKYAQSIGKSIFFIDPRV